jgi:DNA-directed RNA polymerase specialized sigma24 family protein
MLQELVKHQEQLLKMAISICKSEEVAQDVLQDTYIKLHDSGKKFEEVNTGYIYFTMKSIFLDSVKQSTGKNRFIPTDNFINLVEDIEPAKVIVYKNLSNFEKRLIDALFGREITNDKNEIVKTFEGSNKLKLSRDTGIPYKTICKRFNILKNKIYFETI